MITPEMLSQINDPDALKALVLEWAKTAQEKEKLAQQQEQLTPQLALESAFKIQALTKAKVVVEVKVKSLQATIKFNETYTEKLKLELAHLRRTRFGIKSETLATPQGQFLEKLHNIEVAIIEQEFAQLSQYNPTADAHKKELTTQQGTGCQVLPANLPRIDHLHDLPEDQYQCNKCGFKLVKIIEDISEKLELIPVQLIMHQHIRPQYACNACETIQAKPVASAVTDGSYCSPGLAAWIICNTYLDHLPLYRQEQISQRYGVALSRQTKVNWISTHGHALMPLVQELQTLLLQRSVLHADESPIVKTALDFFACLYKIATGAKYVSVQERTEIRQKHAVPVLEAMNKWLDEQALVVKSAKLFNAISYTLKRWASLTRYAQDSSLPLDNNPVENHIRLIALEKRIGCLWVTQKQAKVWQPFSVY